MIAVTYNPRTEPEASIYRVPGLGAGAAYMVRDFIYQSSTSPPQYSISIRLMEPNGSGSYPKPVTFRWVRVYFLPAT